MEILLFWALLLVCMTIGIQIGFALAIGAFGLIFFFSDGLPWTGVLAIMAQRMYEGADSFTLLALPLFFLAGGFMDAGGISNRLINFAQAFVGWVRGGLAMVVVVAEMFLSGISGSASADAAAIGSVMIPSLKRRGYSSESQPHSLHRRAHWVQSFRRASVWSSMARWRKSRLHGCLLEASFQVSYLDSA